MSQRGCDACCNGLPTQTKIAQRRELGFDDREAVVDYEICDLCGLIQKDPLPDKEILRLYYQESWQFSEPRPLGCFEDAGRFIADTLGLFGFTAIATALDVGAKDSALLDAVERNGLRIAKRSVIDAQKRDGVEPAWLGERIYEHPEFVDLACAAHVLEHVHSPRGFLFDLWNLTQPGGFIYIEVPALEVIAHVSDNINRAHLRHWSTKSLIELFRGFPSLSIVRMTLDRYPHGWPVTRVLARKGNHDQYGPLTTMFRKQENRQDQASLQAAKRILDYEPEKSVIWGACESLLRIWNVVGHDEWQKSYARYVVVDSYRERFLDWPIQKPADAVEGKTHALIATRHWNSKRDIAAFIEKSHPHLSSVYLYE